MPKATKRHSFITQSMPASWQGMASAPAFTLVEVLVVITIILIITSASVPISNSFERGQAVKASAADFAGKLENLRLKSIGQEVSGKNLTSKPDGQTTVWGIYLNLTANTGTPSQFSILGCPASSSTYPTLAYNCNDKIETVVKLSNGVKFESLEINGVNVPGAVLISFNPFSGENFTIDPPTGIISPGINLKATFADINSQTNYQIKRQVILTKGGNIEQDQAPLPN